MRERRSAACTCLFLLLAASALCAQAPAEQDTRKSCHAFVQNFYDWYLPRALKGGYEDGVFRRKSALFSPELLRALKEDFEAQAKVKDEIVGLDGDPFLNSQDFSEHFVVENVSVKENTCMAEVRGLQSGKKAEYVRPELVRNRGRWIFVNFHYAKSEKPPDENLLGLLKSLRMERQKHPR